MSDLNLYFNAAVARRKAVTEACDVIERALRLVSHASGRDVERIERLEADNAYLQGKWDAADDRCPQCGTGVKASPYVKRLEAVAEAARKIDDELAESSTVTEDYGLHRALAALREDKP